MILLIDNYDSFSYNLYQMVGSICPEIQVVRNDAVTIEEIRKMAPSGMILSPGPGRPEEAGICREVVEKLGSQIPILGVCLGHQAICASYGATVGHAAKLMHGKQSDTSFDLNCPLFAGCKENEPVARYHSLAVVESTLPASFIVTARADDGEIMAVQHQDYPIYGVQFHPESIMTPSGGIILENFVKLLGGKQK